MRGSSRAERNQGVSKSGMRDDGALGYLKGMKRDDHFSVEHQEQAVCVNGAMHVNHWLQGQHQS